jgi:hypothetical protein
MGWQYLLLNPSEVIPKEKSKEPRKKREREERKNKNNNIGSLIHMLDAPLDRGEKETSLDALVFGLSLDFKTRNKMFFLCLGWGFGDFFHCNTINC